MDLFYREYGHGQPFLILHGVLGISDNWVSFGKRIAHKGYRVIIPDQRNHGHSPHHHVFNYYALVDDLVELLEKLGIEKPVILGHSMGGKVAMRFSLENPGITQKLIIVDTSLRTYTRFRYHRNYIEAMLSVDFNTVKSRTEVEALLSNKIEVERVRQFLLKNLYWRDKHYLGWRPNLKAIWENIESMYDGVFYSTTFKGDTIFIRGGRSDYILEDDWLSILKNFPNATLKTIENGSHWVHADEPELFWSMIEEFLDRKKEV